LYGKGEKMAENIYDVIVLGGGPAGYTAALYAVRAGLKTLIIEKYSAGGQMAITAEIDNYPGFEEGIDGYTLGQKMRKGAERFGAESLFEEVVAVDFSANPKIIKTSRGQNLGKTVIVATGAECRKLGVADEDKLVGRGVSYCATCDGMFYRGKTVAVVGGGNTAAEDALLLSRVCKKVYLIHRRAELRASSIYAKQLERTENVQFIWNSRVKKLLFAEKLTGVQAENVVDGKLTEIAVDGLFVSIGRQPVTSLFKGQLELDESGYILADESTKTSVAGVFAAGDVRTKAVRQIVTATADGAVAVHFAEEFLQGK
jgi:thioredoxin reductase (NADPH)